MREQIKGINQGRSSKKWLVALSALAGLAVIFYVIYHNYFQPDPKPKGILLSQTPHIRLYQNLITPTEAQHLIKIAQNRLEPSTVQVKDQKVTVDGRNSSSAKLKKAEDAIVQRIEARVCALLNCDVKHMEPLQIVHYSQGQKYLPHYDFFSETELPHQTGQRVHTVLVYLNDLTAQDGGQTIFPRLGLQVQPKMGAALYFKDLNDTGKGETLTLHGGAPILTSGAEKWACNIWIRDKPF